jgi:hypothetical protein
MGESSISIKELVPVLQVAVGPVILISGVGLLLLTLSNRFGRAVDRSRQLARELRGASPAERQGLTTQVEVLYRRARLIRLSITLVVVSVLVSALLIIALFVSALLRWEAGALIIMLFVTSLLSLITGLGAFILEIHLSLKALKVELFQPPSARE